MEGEPSCQTLPHLLLVLGTNREEPCHVLAPTNGWMECGRWEMVAPPSKGFRFPCASPGSNISWTGWPLCWLVWINHISSLHHHHPNEGRHGSPVKYTVCWLPRALGLISGGISKSSLLGCFEAVATWCDRSPLSHLLWPTTLCVLPDIQCK